MELSVTHRDVASYVREMRGQLPALRKKLAALDVEPAGREELRRHFQAMSEAAASAGLKALSRLARGLATGLGEDAAQGGEARERLRRTLEDVELALAGFELQAGRVAAARAPRSGGPSRDDDADELAEIFRFEAEDHFEALGELFGRLQRDLGDRAALRDVQRRAHSLKGAAGTAGLADVSALAHRMEDLLDAVLEGRRAIGAATLALLRRTTDAVQSMVHQEMPPEEHAALQGELYESYDEVLGAPAAGGPAAPAPAPRAAARAHGGREPEGAAPTRVQPAVRLTLDRYEELQSLVGELIISRGAVEQHLGGLGSEIEEHEAGVGRLERIAEWLQDEAESGRPAVSPLAPPRGPAMSPSPGPAADGFDDLELDRYTEIDVMARHLAETAADLHTVAGDLRALLRSLRSSLVRESRLVGQLESRLTQGRLVSFRSLVPRLERAVRLTADQQGKEVDFVARGQEVAIDKLILEELADPLLHLARNAVGHGIEPPADRRAAGKDGLGRLTISATSQGRQVVIEVRDDGRGLDPEKIRATAEGLGLFERHPELARLDGRELFSLIFLPGFSTASSIDEISGRGIGMDVVESTVQRLNGDVRLDSEAGRGTQVTLRLPLSLATDRVFLARVGPRQYAIPQAYVEEVVSPGPAAIEDDEDEPVLRKNGRTYPVLRLADLLGIPSSKEDVRAGDRHGAIAFLFEHGGAPAALLVDALVGSREVVVKPLGEQLQRVRGVIGATILGDGRLILILNPSELATAAERTRALPHPVLPRPLAAPRPEIAVLVVDDSLSIRRAVSASVERAGWRAITARDGQEALEILQQRPSQPAAIVLDVEMPRMDGYDFTATLRGLEEYARIPIVMLTSRSGEKHRQQALALGASAYLTKPYQEDVLLATIRRLTAEGHPV